MASSYHLDTRARRSSFPPGEPLSDRRPTDILEYKVCQRQVCKKVKTCACDIKSRSYAYKSYTGRINRIPRASGVHSGKRVEFSRGPARREYHSFVPFVRSFERRRRRRLAYIESVYRHAVRGYAAAPRCRGETQVTPTGRDATRAERARGSPLTSAPPPAPAACKHRGIRDASTCGPRCSCGRPPSFSCRRLER